MGRGQRYTNVVKIVNVMVLNGQRRRVMSKLTVYVLFKPR